MGSVGKPVVFTRHALARMQDYSFDQAWVAATVHAPDWCEVDTRIGVERRFKYSHAHGGRAIRVACMEELDHIRILTVFPDRDAKAPDAP